MAIQVVHSPSAEVIAQAAATGGAEELRRYQQQLALEQQKLALSRSQILQQGQLSREQMALQAGLQARSIAAQQQRDYMVMAQQNARDRLLGGLDLMRQQMAGAQRQQMLQTEWQGRQQLTGMELASREGIANANLGMQQQAMTEATTRQQAGFQHTEQMQKDLIQARIDAADVQRQMAERERDLQFDMQFQSTLGAGRAALEAMDGRVGYEDVSADLRRNLTAASKLGDNLGPDASRDAIRRYQMEAARLEGVIAQQAKTAPQPVKPADQALENMVTVDQIKQRFPATDPEDILTLTSRNGTMSAEPLFKSTKPSQLELKKFQMDQRSEAAATARQIYADQLKAWSSQIPGGGNPLPKPDLQQIMKQVDGYYNTGAWDGGTAAAASDAFMPAAYPGAPPTETTPASQLLDFLENDVTTLTDEDKAEFEKAAPGKVKDMTKEEIVRYNRIKREIEKEWYQPPASHPLYSLTHETKGPRMAVEQYLKHGAKGGYLQKPVPTEMPADYFKAHPVDTTEELPQPIRSRLRTEASQQANAWVAQQREAAAKQGIDASEGSPAFAKISTQGNALYKRLYMEALSQFVKDPTDAFPD